MRSRSLLPAVVLVVGLPSSARGDLIDAEIFSSRMREVQEINNTQQLRRTMNRSFDAAGWMGGDDAGGAGLSRHMAEVFNRRHFTIRDKQDARDYYVLVRAIIAPAARVIIGARPIDAKQRASLAFAARTFVLHDTGADPQTVSWDRLPCVGVADVVCQAQTAIARNIFSR